MLQFDWTLSWQAMKVGEAAKKKPGSLGEVLGGSSHRWIRWLAIGVTLGINKWDHAR